MKTTTGGLQMRDPRTLVKKTGGGTMALFGLPFFASGVLVIVMALGLIPVQNPEEGPGPMGVLFGLPFILIGLGFMLGRGGVIVDLTSGTVVKWWGLLAPFSRKSFQIDIFSKVTVKREVRGSGKSQRTVYAVRLESDTSPEQVELSAPQNFDQGRADGEQLAKFVNKRLVDFTSGAPVERAPDRLDESLREQVRRDGKQVERPGAPYNMRTRVTEMGGEVVLDMPGPGVSKLKLLMVVPAMIFAVFASAIALPSMITDKDMDSGSRAIIMSLFVVFFVLVPIGVSLGMALSKTKRSYRVTASGAGLRVEEKGLVRTRVTEIRSDELEELTLPDAMGLMRKNASPDNPFMDQGGNTGTMRMKNGQPVPNIVMTLLSGLTNVGITARSDRATVSFGQGLSAEELKYIYALIKEAVTR